jgi:hypothetical protein
MVDFNTTLTPIERSSKEKINKEILELNDTIDQMDLTDVYRIFYQTTAQHTFFSTAHESFLQNRSCIRAQSKPQQIQEDRNNPLHSI